MRGCSYKRVDYGGCEAWVRGVLGNLGGLCVMCLIHFEGLFEIIYYIFDKGVLGREILRVFFCGHMKCRSILSLIVIVK